MPFPRESRIVTSVMWFRRDLRLMDNPALLAAAAEGDAEVVPLFVLDPALWRPAGSARRAYLNASLNRLSERVGGLQLRRGDPVQQVVSVARAADARTVHIAADFGPYGSRRDRRVEEALRTHGIDLVRTGSPYAIDPGQVLNKSGAPYQVFTPFSRAWRQQGRPQPVAPPQNVAWARPLTSHPLYRARGSAGVRSPTAGEEAALRCWRDFLTHRLGDYERAGTGRIRTARHGCRCT